MIYALVTLSLLLPLLVILAYRQGIRDGRAITSNAPLKPIVPQIRKPSEDKTNKRLMAILDNIDCYDGTGKGQKKVVSV